MQVDRKEKEGGEGGAREGKKSAVALWWPEAAVYRESVKNGNVTKVTF
jgi:hypothetical protein